MEPFSIQSLKKRHQQINGKINVEKVLKLDAKRGQKDARIEPQINDFKYFFVKGRKCKISEEYNAKRGSGHAKGYQKSIQNRCKNDARKKHANYIENVSKMGPK